MLCSSSSLLGLISNLRGADLTSSLAKNKYLKYLKNALKLEYLWIYASIILSAGFVAYVLNARYVPATSIIVVGQFQEQSLIETLIYAFVIIMGFGGVYLMARSISDSQMDRVKGLFFIMGIGFLFLSFIMIYSLWSYKIFG